MWWRRNGKPDPVFILLASLLSATLALFVMDRLPYPFGVMVLGFLLIARGMSNQQDQSATRNRRD